jgi:hypothetical protein
LGISFIESHSMAWKKSEDDFMQYMQWFNVMISWWFITVLWLWEYILINIWYMMIINQLLLYYYIYIYLYYLWIFTMYMDRPERNPLVLSTRSMDLHQLKEEKPPRLQPVFNGCQRSAGGAGWAGGLMILEMVNLWLIYVNILEMVNDDGSY